MREQHLDRISGAIADLMRAAESRRVHRARQEAVGVDLGHTELRFLALVAETGPAGGSGLGRQLQLSQPTASRVLRKLEVEGYVRAQAASDGRMSLYEATEAGRDVVARFAAVRRHELQRALADLPTARVGDLADLLEAFVSGAYLRTNEEAPSERT